MNLSCFCKFFKITVIFSLIDQRFDPVVIYRRAFSECTSVSLSVTSALTELPSEIISGELGRKKKQKSFEIYGKVMIWNR